MKPAPLEPGLLRVIQILMLLQVFGLPLVRRQVGAGMGVEVSLLPWLFITAPVPLFLVLYAWHPWWRRTLGRAFLPLLLVIQATNMLVDKYLTLAWVVPPPQQELEALLLVVRLWFLLHMLTLLVAWQYSLAWVLATALLLSFGDAVLTLPFVATSSPFYPLLFLLFLARAGTVTWVAVMVGWLVGRLRAQRRAVIELNQQLAHYAATAEQLAVSQERNRLARELHDTLAHSLSGVSVQLEAAQALWERDDTAARKMVDQALGSTRHGLAEARRALRALRASPLDDLGLGLAVGTLAESVAARANLRLTLAVPGHLEPLPPEVEQAVYRIAQEVLSNVARHAEASQVSVTLARHNGQITLTIHDDGRGFDPTDVEEGHYGLRGLCERAAMLGGTLVIDSHPQQGTTVTLEVGG
jgi:signal transduction histidine kinase